MPTLGLVVSGGGARGAYQAGVLAAIGDICADLKINQPFKIYTSVSAGAINSCFLTCYGGNFADGSQRLLDIWKSLKSEDIFISNPIVLAEGGLEWLAALSFGGMKKNVKGKSLLNTSPLLDLINKNCDFSHLAARIERKEISAFGVTALDYYSSSSVTFVQGDPKLRPWERVRRRSEATTIKPEHLMASAAIPLLFTPVPIGDRFFGDGSIRNLSPCAPAIYMGSERLIAIGVRQRQEMCHSKKAKIESDPPTVARVASVLLNTLMMDGIELDMERIQRINKNLSTIPKADLSKIPVRNVDALWIAPSKDLSTIAANKSHELPRMIRYLLRGLGSLEEASEISSFLLFEKEYINHLIDLGYNDGMNEKQNIIKMLTDQPINEEKIFDQSL